jgi:hypothetical protein
MAYRRGDLHTTWQTSSEGAERTDSIKGSNVIIELPDHLWQAWLAADVAYKADTPQGRDISVEQHKVIVDRLRAGMLVLMNAEVVEGELH